MKLRVYGHFAKNLENTTHCIVEVSDGYGWGWHQCSRKRGHGEGGLFCKQHSKTHTPESLGVPLKIIDTIDQVFKVQIDAIGKILKGKLEESSITLIQDIKIAGPESPDRCALALSNFEQRNKELAAQFSWDMEALMKIAGEAREKEV